MNRFSASCVMKRGVCMSIILGVLVGISVPWGVSFGTRCGDCCRFITQSVAGAGVAPMLEDCRLTPSEVAMRPHSEVDAGSLWDVGRIPGVFAQVSRSDFGG